MNIVDARYEEWTRRLSPEQARVRLFEKVRDIPYLIDIRLMDLEKGPAGILKAGAGACNPKHYLLGAMLEKLGLEVKYCIFPFRWKDAGIDCPETVRGLSEAIPVTYHLANRVLLEGEWVLVDATWDLPLKRAGFPVNDSWNGTGDTRLAIEPLGEKEYDDPAQSQRELLKTAKEYSLTDKLELSRFSLEFNKWLEEIRK